MMLHDKIVPGQFLLDMKNDCANNLLHGSQHGSKSDIFNPFTYHHYHPQERFSSEVQVLDLSRRLSSVETIRKTPSPYNTTSSFGTASPSTHCESPPASTTQQPVILAEQSKLSSSPPQEANSIFPLYYPHFKREIASPTPSSVSSITSPNSSPLFTQRTAKQQKARPSALATSLSSPKSSLLSISSETGNLYPNILNAATTGNINLSKSTRPFNAYPRDPLMVAAHFAASDVLYDNTTFERYTTFRKRALDDISDSNGGQRTVTNPKMRRTNHRNCAPNSEYDDKAVESSDNDSSSNSNGSSAECSSNKNDGNNNGRSGDVKDEAYYERRRKNNAAAKKSRDRRRIKEDELAIRAAYLERQNIELLCQIDTLKKQLSAASKK